MYNFRKVVESDFSKLYNWLRSEHVKEFWYPDSSFTFEEISNKYRDRIMEGKIDIFIIVVNAIDIGYIQSYVINDTSPYKATGLGKGIDLYIGESEYIHKGFGKSIILDYINKYIFCDE